VNLEADLLAIRPPVRWRALMRRQELAFVAHRRRRDLAHPPARYKRRITLAVLVVEAAFGLVKFGLAARGDHITVRERDVVAVAQPAQTNKRQAFFSCN